MGNIYYSDGTATGNNFPGGSVQWIHDNQVIDGNNDVISLPAGTFSWTTGITITKSVTLQGSTTINGAGTENCIANDNTIITDDISRTGYRGQITITASGNKLSRLTGISFFVGSAATLPNNPGFRVMNTAPNPATAVRIDNCHFKNLNLSQVIGVSGWVYGVCDHNFFEFIGASRNGFEIYHEQFGGADRSIGNGSFENPPFFGSGKFWFIETNTFTRSGTLATGVTDCLFGGRFVFRHNYVIKGVVADHGTEAGARGVRCKEIYNNIFNMIGAPSQSGSRGGSGLVHDNTYIGTLPNPGVIYSLNNFRMTGEQSANPLWGTSDGTSLFDENVTDVGNDPFDKNNQIFIEGHTPYIFNSGTATSTQQAGTITDTNANGGQGWGINQLAGYSIHKPNAAPNTCYGSLIISNTQFTISYDPISTNPNARLIFNFGDSYEIRRVLIVMDGCGRGVTDQQDYIGGKEVLHSTGQAGYPHPASEPWYSWNNVHQGGVDALGFSSAYPTININEDYFNLGNGFLVNETPTAVSSMYEASRNGADYTGTYIYPHPLASKTINLSSGLMFGNCIIGQTMQTTLYITNMSDTVVTINNINYPTGFSGATSGFTILPGAIYNILVTFSPINAQIYNGNIIVVSDDDLGVNMISTFGVGINRIHN